MREEPEGQAQSKGDGKINQFDGLIHNADGTKDFAEANGGGPVGGVNNYRKVEQNGDFIHDFKATFKK